LAFAAALFPCFLALPAAEALTFESGAGFLGALTGLLAYEISKYENHKMYKQHFFNTSETNNTNHVHS
jgi:hypothetical protein